VAREVWKPIYAKAGPRRITRGKRRTACRPLPGRRVKDADFIGYSMGGAIALQVAIRHPALVRKLVVASATFRSDGMPVEALAMLPSITPELFAGTPIEEEYLRIAPNPGDFPSWSRSSRSSTRRTSPGRRRAFGRSPRPR
jgi:pimeloyl-ACP methyl ester carboxylesterase